MPDWLSRGYVVDVDGESDLNVLLDVDLRANTRADTDSTVAAIMARPN